MKSARLLTLVSPPKCPPRIGLLAILLASMFVTASAQTYTILYTFSGGADGGYPQYGGLLPDAAGNLYGTATFGGDTTSLW